MITFKAQIENPRSHGNTETGEQVETLIQELSQVRDDVNSKRDTLPEGTADVKDLARDILRGLHKRILQFQTNRFFVAVFGSLKAGKSTLINALVGRHVSPTGHGQETTLHCSIILKATPENPEGIYLHRNVSPEPKSGQALRRMAVTLLDYFREMETLDAVAVLGVERSRHFDFNGHDLSGQKDNLTAVLTEKELTTYPNVVLVEIRVDCGEQNAFLNQVALFDMPGLEGCVANADNDPVIQELRNVADYFIYVQSSVGALSDDAAKYINSVVNQQKKTMVIVFNKIMGKFWLSPASQQKEQETYEKSACEILSDRANIRRPDAFNVNAAQAWSALNDEFQLGTLNPTLYPPSLTPVECRQRLLEESGIEKLKEHLLQVCQERIIPIQDKNAIEKYSVWRQEILQPDGPLGRHIDELEKSLAKLQKDYSTFQNIFMQIPRTTYSCVNGPFSGQTLDATAYRQKFIWELKAKTTAALNDFIRALSDHQLSPVYFPAGEKVQSKYTQYLQWDDECKALIENAVGRIAVCFQAAGLHFLEETRTALQTPLHGLEDSLGVPENGAFATVLVDFPKNVEGFSFSRYFTYPELPEVYRKRKLKSPGTIAKIVAWLLKFASIDRSPQREYRDDLISRFTSLLQKAFKRFETDVQNCETKLREAMRDDLNKAFNNCHGKIQKAQTRLEAAKQLKQWLEALPKVD